MIDSRLKILSIITLSIAFSLSQPEHIGFVVATTVFFSIIYYKYLIKSLLIVLSTFSFIMLIGLLSWLITSDINPVEILLGSVKWISLILVTFLIFSSFNLFEFISSLVYFRVNTKIAISFGVGLRFLPLVIDEGKKIVAIQRRRGVLKHKNMFSKINYMLSPFLISIVRRVDSITLSMTTQQIEIRVKDFEFNSIKWTDYLLMFLCVFLIIYVM